MNAEDGVGSLADEAARLLDAVRGMLGPQGALGPAHIATGAPECTWCPLCQLIAVLRGDRPEVSARLAEATQAVSAAVRILLEAVTAVPEPTRARTARNVQHIDLREE